MIKLIDILNEYKINPPSNKFCFIDTGSETYYLDLMLRQHKSSQTSQEDGDNNMFFTFPTDNGIENAPDDPLNFVKTIEYGMSDGSFDQDFDIVFFKALITNLVNAKIPINDLDFFTDGGWDYIDLTLSYKNIQKYIIPFDKAPDWFKEDN